MIAVAPNIFHSETGLYIDKGQFYLDPSKPVTDAVISHAHADHFVLGHRNVYCTPATAAILSARYGNKLNCNFVLKDYGQFFQLNNCKLSFHSAGHMLGSGQVLMEVEDARILYTGDFKLQADDTCAPFEFIETDILITESTFANPSVKHPEAETEIAKINEFENRNIIIGTYVLGKAQRLNSLIEKNCSKYIVMLHHDIVPFHKVYADFGIKINNWIPYSRRVFKQQRNCIYLVPPVIYKYYYNQFKVLKAFASGWDRLQKGSDFPLYISDHADWNQLLKLIEVSKPKTIITLHGDGRFLKSYSESQPFEVINL